VAKEFDGPSVTARAFSVLDSFDSAHRRQKLSAIARRAGLPLTTAHRLVGDLVEQGALIRTADGSYEIGSKMWSLGILASLHADLREIALPYMEDVYQIANDAVQIAVLDGFRCLIVERIAGSRTLEVVSRPGARLPLHASGVGKVLLAHGSNDLQQAALKTLDGFTPKTITDPKEIERQIREIQQQGFAVSVEELAPGASSIAVPIRGQGKKVIAALGIVSPSKALDVQRMVPVLRVTAAALSTKLLASGMVDSLAIR
jgi:DNA-binding IclR family transcriptional regulator